jgi:hypothetical protein
LVSSSWSLNSDGLALSKNLILPSSISSSWNASDRTPCERHGVLYDRQTDVFSLDLLLSPDFNQVRRWAPIEMGLEDVHVKYL